MRKFLASKLVTLLAAIVATALTWAALAWPTAVPATKEAWLAVGSQPSEGAEVIRPAAAEPPPPEVIVRRVVVVQRHVAGAVDVTQAIGAPLQPAPGAAAGAPTGAAPASSSVAVAPRSPAPAPSASARTRAS